MQVLGTGQPPEAPPALRTHRRTVCLSWLSAEEGRQAVWMVEAVAVYPVRVTRRPGKGRMMGHLWMKPNWKCQQKLTLPHLPVEQGVLSGGNNR